MIAARLIQLIETHAATLTREVMQDLMTNERTAAFRAIPKHELELRISALFVNLGRWLGDPSDAAVRKEYEDWGRARFDQGVPLSEILYGLILTKGRLRRYIRDHGVVSFSGDAVIPGELLPVELYSVQELNYTVGEFFDRALYHLARGYEAEAAAKRAAIG